VENVALKEAVKQLNALTDAQKKAENSGQTMAAKLIEKQAIQQEKKVETLKVADAPDNVKKAEGVVNIKKLNEEADKATADFDKTTKEIRQETLEITVEADVKLMLEKGQFKEALALELKTNKEILALQEQLVGLEPFKNDEQGLQRYQAVAEKIGALQNQIQAKFMAAEEEFAKKRVETEAQTQEKINQAREDWHQTLLNQKEAELKLIDENVQKGLLALEKGEEAKLVLIEKYNKEVLAKSQEAEIQRIEQQQKTLEKMGKPRDPEL
jgi:hypothetical protein